MASRYSVDQSSSVAGLAAGKIARTASSPRISQPAFARSSRIGKAMRCQRRRGRSASVSAAPQTPVRRILAFSDDGARLGEIGLRMDIDMANAFEMGEHRHARFGHHAAGQALAAARNDEIDRAVRGPSSIRPTAARSVVGTRLIAASGKSGRAQAFDHRGMDRARRNARIPSRRAGSRHCRT